MVRGKQRISPNFEQRIREAARRRVINKVDLKTRSFPEMTEMMLNTRNMENVLNDLENIPKDEDFKKWKLGKL